MRVSNGSTYHVLAGVQRTSYRTMTLLLAILVFGCGAVMCLMKFTIHSYTNNLSFSSQNVHRLLNLSYKSISPTTRETTSHAADVLLIYVYADTHSYALGNLQYFVTNAVRKNDPVDYYFIVQQVNGSPVNESRLPVLPRNARYIQHENSCFDFGTVGWFLRSFTINNRMSNETMTNFTINLSRYRYFILMNGSIRGPYFPPYYQRLLFEQEDNLKRKFFWYSVFTSRLSDTVKLVGCTISCQISPHVQGYLMVTDFVGLSLLLNTSNENGIFACYKHLWDVIIKSEVAASTRILQAGYQIDSLQTKYQGWDFRKKENRNCNDGKNPYYDRTVDGLTLDPYEVVFIKFNYKAYKEAADRATIYEKWAVESIGVRS